MVCSIFLVVEENSNRSRSVNYKQVGAINCLLGACCKNIRLRNDVFVRIAKISIDLP